MQMYRKYADREENGSGVRGTVTTGVAWQDVARSATLGKWPARVAITVSRNVLTVQNSMGPLRASAAGKITGVAEGKNLRGRNGQTRRRAPHGTNHPHHIQCSHCRL